MPFDHSRLGDEDSLPEEIQKKERVMGSILQLGAHARCLNHHAALRVSVQPLRYFLKRVAFSRGVVCPD